MVKCGVLFEVRTEFINKIYTSFGFKGSANNSVLLGTLLSDTVRNSHYEMLYMLTGFTDNHNR
jgi:hypothetical protein